MIYALSLKGYFLNYSEEDIISAGSYLAKRGYRRFCTILTCAHCEIYSEDEINIEAFLHSLKLNPIKYKAKVDVYTHIAAIEHFFMLSSGILSPYFGEDIISSQISLSLRCSISLGLSSKSLDLLLRRGVEFSKRVHKEVDLTSFDKGFLPHIIKLIENKSVLLVGSGKKARYIAQSIKDRCNLTQSLRDESKRDFLSFENVRVINYSKIREILPSIDVVIGSSSSQSYVFTVGDKKILDNKTLIDLAPWPDFDPSLNAINDDALEYDRVVRRSQIDMVSSLVKVDIDDYLKTLKRVIRYLWWVKLHNRRKRYIQTATTKVDHIDESLHISKSSRSIFYYANFGVDTLKNCISPLGLKVV